MTGNPEAEATLQRQGRLVLPNAVAFTDPVRKHLATTGYLSALGTAVEAHLATILRGSADPGSLADG
jgi:hypothetical protein